ncbi:MAG: hypothetical protein GC160_13570 [Acidobacteria bacterium]|nr:hypothetical protein [Acidobacteriota bacterium]
MQRFLPILLLLTLLPLQAQLKIGNYPDYNQPPPIQPAETEKEAEKEARRVYSGDPVEVDALCQNDTLLQAGLSCTPRSPCRLELELIWAQEVGDRLLVGGSVRTAEGALESILLASDDGGGSWTEPVERTPAATLDAAQFVDNLIGWVGGQRAVDAAVSEPFLLYTDDGGNTFSTRPVRSGDESEEGFILEMQFDAEDHGYLILERPNAAVDPFALFETYNGGRSWSIRQIVAERPAIPGARRRTRAAAAGPELRLTTTADGNIALERRSGADWARLARFRIPLGSCPAPALSSGN